MPARRRPTGARWFRLRLLLQAESEGVRCGAVCSSSEGPRHPATSLSSAPCPGSLSVEPARRMGKVCSTRVSCQRAPPCELTRGLRHARRDGRPWHVAGPAPTAPRWAHITRRHNAAARRARAHAGGALPPTSISEHVRGRGEAWNREYLARPGEAASARRDHQSAVS